MFMDQERVKVCKHSKHEGGQLSSHLDRTSLVNIKGFIIMGKEDYFLARHNRYFKARRIAPS